MIFMGNVGSKMDAVLQAWTIANREKRVVVLEKAKAKDADGRKRVCWRGFLDIRGEFTGRMAPAVAIVRHERNGVTGKSVKVLEYLEGS